MPPWGAALATSYDMFYPEIEAKIQANPRFKIVREPGTGVIISAAPARAGDEERVAQKETEP